MLSVASVLFSLVVYVGSTAALSHDVGVTGVRGVRGVPCVAQPVVLRQTCLRLRGGDDLEGDDGLDGDLDDEGLEEAADSSLAASAADENPFLQSARGPSGESLQELAQSLKDPKMLQDALKELQDPATQQRIKAMMEDPEFLNSMKSYVEQITKDPQFDALKRQTEAMMQDPAFVEQMTKSMMSGDMGKTIAEMAEAAQKESSEE